MMTTKRELLQRIQDLENFLVQGGTGVFPGPNKTLRFNVSPFLTIYVGENPPCHLPPGHIWLDEDAVEKFIDMYEDLRG